MYKIKNLVILILVAINTLFLFQSCGDDSDSVDNGNVVGVWTGCYYMPTGRRVDGTFTFLPDGTGSYERVWGDFYGYAAFTYKSTSTSVHCKGSYAENSGYFVEDWDRTIEFTDGGTKFEYGGIVYQKQ